MCRIAKLRRSQISRGHPDPQTAHVGHKAYIKIKGAVSFSFHPVGPRERALDRQVIRDGADDVAAHIFDGNASDEALDEGLKDGQPDMARVQGFDT